MEQLINYIKSFLSGKKSGTITINIFKGGVTSWNVKKTFKPKDFDNKQEK